MYMSYILRIYERRVIQFVSYEFKLNAKLTYLLTFLKNTIDNY